MNNKLLVLSGPTGVGKTSLSIKLAKLLNGEIISADSMQVYKYMDIGSAKIKKEEAENIKHHLIDVCEPSDEFNVSIYVKLAKQAINDILSRNMLPIIVGGTGLYIRSLLYDQKQCDCGEDKDFRDELYKVANEKGVIHVHEMLKDIDFLSYSNIHYNNLKRVVRALEVYHLTKKPFSSFKTQLKPLYDFKYYVINMDRDKLYSRINKRVDLMMKQGLIQEVAHLKNKGYSKDLQSMQGIGYKEVLEYINGTTSLDCAIDKIKKGSRNYAKRQITWFRKELNSEFIFKDKLSDNEILDYIIKNFNN